MIKQWLHILDQVLKYQEKYLQTTVRNLQKEIQTCENLSNQVKHKTLNSPWQNNLCECNHAANDSIITLNDWGWHMFPSILHWHGLFKQKMFAYEFWLQILSTSFWAQSKFTHILQNSPPPWHQKLTIEIFTTHIGVLLQSG